MSAVRGHATGAGAETSTVRCQHAYTSSNVTTRVKRVSGRGRLVDIRGPAEIDAVGELLRSCKSIDFP